MIAIIKGDIIASRKLQNQDLWLRPLKDLLASWGQHHKTWELHSGDFFQIEIAKPEEALHKVLEIKSLIKKVEPKDKTKKSSTIDVRMAIGIGYKTYTGESIAESNGPAFIYSSEKFAVLKKENVSTGIKTPWKSFDEEMNLYLRLAGVFMDKWTVSAAELVHFVLHKPEATQEEIGKYLGIKQNSVSGRWNRANVNEILALEKLYRHKIKSLVSP